MNANDEPLRQDESMQPALKTVLNHIRESMPVERWLSFPLIIAASGGPDSTALLRLVQILRQEHGYTSVPLMVAHYNHGTRGIESEEDEQFASGLAGSMHLPFLCRRQASELGTSEEQLRDERYRFLVQSAKETGARLIATGHNADDQAETILFRILRGTGLSGLTGIPQVTQLDSTVSIIRPLLGVKRTDIELILAELGQPFRHDSSNSQSNYTRNFLRQTIFPVVRERFGDHVSDNLIRLGRQAADMDAYLDSQALEMWRAVVNQTPNEIRIDCGQLTGCPQIVRRQLFKRIWMEQQWPMQSMTYENWSQLAQRTDGTNLSAVILPGKIRCENSGFIMSLRKES